MHSSPLRRDREINFGTPATVTGAERITLASINVPQSTAFTIYATARVTAPDVLLPFLRPLVQIEWGHGSAVLRANYPVGSRLRVPLAASMIELEGRLVDTRTGHPAPVQASAHFTAFIAHGTDGETIPTTRTLAQSGTEDQLAQGPQRLLALRGYNPGSAPLWIMLFDATRPVPNGESPLVALPAPPSPATFEYAPKSPREFYVGIRWATSSTPLTYTPSLEAVRIEAELLP